MTAVAWLAISLSACENPHGNASAPQTPASESRTAPATAPPTPTAPLFASIEIWPAGPRPPSEFLLPKWVAPFTHGRDDFYAWDGTFLRTLDVPGDLGASVDGHYFVNYTTGQLWSSTGQDMRPFTEPTLEEGSTALNWASDGDYLCGLESTGAGFALFAEDLAGTVQRFRLQVPPDVVPTLGLRAMHVECSLSSARAVVIGGTYPHVRAALVSLPDGNVLTDIPYDAGGSGPAVSPDSHWLLANNDVVDLTTGTVLAHLDGHYYAWFTPDGQHVIGSDGQDLAAVLDWRSSVELWRGPSPFNTVLAHSDPATNRMLLVVSTGSAQAGTEIDHYWIVSGNGIAFRFNPRD